MDLTSNEEARLRYPGARG